MEEGREFQVVDGATWNEWEPRISARNVHSGGIG